MPTSPESDKPEPAQQTVAAKLSAFLDLLPKKTRSAYADVLIEVAQLENTATDLAGGWDVVRAVAHAAHAAGLGGPNIQPHMPKSALDLGQERCVLALGHLPTAALHRAIRLCEMKAGAVQVHACRPGCRSDIPIPTASSVPSQANPRKA